MLLRKHLQLVRQSLRGQMADQAQPGPSLPPAQSQERTVNVWSPDGQLQSLPESQLDDATQAGYQQATPEDYTKWANEQQYGGPLEQAKTFAEGAAQAATFGASTALERGLGVSGRAIR